jgi:hypothetical protein
MNIFRKKSFQVPFTDSNDVIEQIAPTTLDPALCYAILPGTFERGPHWAYFQGSDGCRNLNSVLTITVEDQEPKSRLKRKRFPQLLDDPTARRMLRDVEVQDASTIMTNDKEAIEHAERDRWHCEVVHRCNRFPMIAEKS